MLAIRYPVIKSTQDLKTALQNAIKLEHATIPPYLTAWWTLSGTTPGAAAARQILYEIFIDEMYHMLAMCNLLNAIGGAPVLNAPGFVPRYPDCLPMTIGSTAGSPFVVGIRRYSNALVRDTFMAIEKPEHPISIPIVAAVPPIADHYDTIGQFYEGVASAIKEGGPDLFLHPSSPQVIHDQMSPITDVDSALAHITVIREQGEGTTQSALSAPKTFAHYYRFESLAKGMTLVPDDGGVGHFDPARPIVVDDTADVVQMVDDPGQADLSQDPVAAQLADDFDAAYRALLDALHEAVNGKPGRLSAAIYGLMYGLTDSANAALKHQIGAGPHAGQFLGPRFLIR